MGRKSAVLAQFEQMSRARRRASRDARGQRFQARVGKIAAWSQLTSNVQPYVSAAVALKASTARRFYAHGDQSETDPQLFFCAHADRFKPFGLFMYEPATSSMMRYAMDLRLWEKLARRAEWRRPAMPENIIDPPSPGSATATLLKRFRKAQQLVCDWLAALPEPDDSLDTPLELPPYELKFPEHTRRADLQRNLNRLIRAHGIKHLKVLNARLRDEGASDAN